MNLLKSTEKPRVFIQFNNIVLKPFKNYKLKINQFYFITIISSDYMHHELSQISNTFKLSIGEIQLQEYESRLVCELYYLNDFGFFIKK